MTNLFMISAERFISEILWGRDLKYQDHTFIPIVGHIDSSDDIKVYTENVSDVMVTELENEEVGRVQISSNGRERVLVIPGIILEGGRQTRTAIRPFIVNPNSTAEIPVNCVEQGRWGYRSMGKRERFVPSSHMVSSKIRYSLNKERVNQSETWEDIYEYIENAEIDHRRVPTQSFAEVKRQIKDTREQDYQEVKSSLDRVFGLPEQRGILILKEGKPAHLEVYQTSAMWKAIADKIMESIVVDLILDEEKGTYRDNKQERVNIEKISLEARDAIADEICFRAKMGSLSGWAIGSDEELVYLVLSDTKKERKRKRHTTRNFLFSTFDNTRGEEVDETYLERAESILEL